MLNSTKLQFGMGREVEEPEQRDLGGRGSVRLGKQDRCGRNWRRGVESLVLHLVEGGISKSTGSPRDLQGKSHPKQTSSEPH